jgi:hypothetical protein
MIEKGNPRREVVLADPLGDRRYVVKSIPAFVYGLAFGDIVEIIDEQSGEFLLLERGGNVTIRVYVRGDLERPSIRKLIEDVTRVDGGQYEVGSTAKDKSQLSLLLLTVPVTLGFKTMESWLAGLAPAEWEYGNVYDSNGRPLMWWPSNGRTAD